MNFFEERLQKSAYRFGQALAYLDIAASNLEAGMDPNEVASFIREKLKGIDPDNCPLTTQDQHHG